MTNDVYRNREGFAEHIRKVWEDIHLSTAGDLAKEMYGSDVEVEGWWEDNTYILHLHRDGETLERVEFQHPSNDLEASDA